MADSLGTARIDITADASGVVSAADAAKKSISSMSADAQKEYQKLSTVERRRVDSLIQQADKLNMTKAQQIAYNAALRGVPASVLDDLTKRLNASGGAAQTASGQMQQYGMSAKATAAAMRGVPAQMTDIIVSLQGGQRPLTVLLQQGGQLKDMFGGIVPAAKALGSTVMAMVNPFTVAAASIGTLAMAYYKGANEMNAFRNNLIMTGGAIGVSANQVAQMAVNLDKLGGITRGGATEALTAVAATGKIAGAQLEKVTGIAIQMSSVLGVEMDEIVADFAKLSKDPAKSAAELNEKYHFLTAAVYEQVEALERQGRVQEATAVATNALTDALNSRLGEVRENLGYLESGWNAVGKAAASAWDFMKGVGRENTGAELIAQYEKLIAGAETLEKKGNKKAGENAANLRAQLGVLKGMAVAEEEEVRIAKEYGQEQTAAIKAHEKINKLLQDGASKSEKMTKEIADYRRNLEDIRKANPDSKLLSTESIAKAEAAIREKYKEPTKEKGIAAGIRVLQNLKEQGAALQAQILSVGLLTASEKERAKFEQQIADLKVKKVLTADEKSMLAQESTLRIEHERNIAFEKQVKHKEAMLKAEERYQQILAQIQSSSASQQEQYERQLGAYGKGSREQDRVESEKSIYREFRRYQDELAKGTPESELGSDKYKTQSAKISAELQNRLAAQRNYYAEVGALESSWSLGADQALANYADQAKNVFSSVEGMVSSAFKGMEDSIVNFVQTGKLSFSDLANSIIADLIKIEMRKAIAGISGGLKDMFGAGIKDPSPGLITAGVSLSGGGYTGAGGVHEPAGIVHKGEIVWSQKDIAKAGGISVVEAMRRGARGYSNGGIVGGGSAVTGGVIINVTNNSSQPVQARETGRTTSLIDGLKQTVVSVILEDQQRNGAITQGFKGVLRG